uniref:Uncharacterized protein n=1 Tax=Brachionus plicatilis TaxID=10195 RepID=A0A3M7RL23_BRAPC|nr:hypothetical protein BpHYR1_038648 [Brachionus plicatilis]
MNESKYFMSFYGYFLSFIDITIEKHYNIFDKSKKIYVSSNLKILIRYKKQRLMTDCVKDFFNKIVQKVHSHPDVNIFCLKNFK